MSIASVRRGIRPSAGRLLCCLVLVAGMAGCAAGRPPERIREAVRIEPVAAPGGEAGRDVLPALPALSVSQTEDPGGGRRIQHLAVVNQDLRTVVRTLAQEFGLNYQVDPEVQGTVTTQLRDVTLQQALDAVVLPHGYTYQVQGTVLRIAPARLQTQIFSLDYISMSRAGIGTTVVQRRLGATGSGNRGADASGGGFGGALGGGGTGGADIIQSVAVSDLWQEIRISLEGLIFDAPAAGGGAGTAGAAPGSGPGAASAPGAFSRVEADGRRLIINPLSGTIVITAPAERLGQVAAFLATVEGSVQRQVLIEAKIVEVSLNRDYQFGIDWNVVQRIGNVELSFNGGQNGAEFRLTSPNGQADRTVGLVLQALEEQGKVQVLSSPRVSVLNNQRAVINVATDEVFFSVTQQPIIGPNGTTIGFNTQVEPQQIAVGIVLDVFPQIAPDNTITMNVRPVITNVVRVEEVRLSDGTHASAPVIDRRETDTVVRVRGGETVVIGGLMQTRRDDIQRGIPGLRDLPLLGGLFGGTRQVEEKRELVIFITPTIVAGQPPIGR